MVNQEKQFVIGKNVSWKTIQPYLLRVTHSSLLARVANHEIKSVSSMPYAILSVECLELKSEFTLYVTHKLDFLHLWQAYEERGVAENEEVLVGDFSQTRQGVPKLLGRVLPKLVVMIYPKGFLEKLAQNDWGDLSGQAWGQACTPLAKWEPDV